MSDATVEKNSGSELKNSDNKKVRPISRSKNYITFYADDTLFFPLGHDIEISFLVDTPKPRQKITVLSDDGQEQESQTYKLKSVLEEAGRVRMPPSVATNLALNILARQASDDIFEKEGLKEHFDTIIDLVPDSSTTDQETE